MTSKEQATKTGRTIGGSMLLLTVPPQSGGLEVLHEIPLAGLAR
jgi:hypothetical protein